MLWSTAAHAALDGLATVLPLSASGHRFVARVWLGAGPDLETIEQASRVGILLGLVLVVWRRLTRALAEGLRGLTRPAVLQRTGAGRDAVAWILASVAAATTELGFRSLASPLNDNWVVVGAGLALTAAALGSTALAPAPRFTSPTSAGAVLAGVAYGMAVLPGSSPVAMAFVVMRWLRVTSFNAFELTLATSIPVLSLSFALDALAARPSSAVPGGELVMAASVAFVGALGAAAAWRWLAHRERSAWLALWLSSLALAVLAYGRALPAPALPAGTAASVSTSARRCPMCVG
jgi:undecaprenyl-diphosphatase